VVAVSALDLEKRLNAMFAAGTEGADEMRNDPLPDLR
jgi:hypothetical protein